MSKNKDHPKEATVPVDELKELIEEWESKSDKCIPNSAGRRAMELAKATDLKELVEEYE